MSMTLHEVGARAHPRDIVSWEHVLAWPTANCAFKDADNVYFYRDKSSSPSYSSHVYFFYLVCMVSHKCTRFYELITLQFTVLPTVRSISVCSDKNSYILFKLNTLFEVIIFRVPSRYDGKISSFILLIRHNQTLGLYYDNKQLLRAW